MHDYALVVNADSSSLKFCVFGRLEREEWGLESQGQIESIGTAPRISARDSEGGILIDRKLDAEVRDGREALNALAVWLRSIYGGGRVVGVGHRVVHGGTTSNHTTVVTPDVLAELHLLVPLASLQENSAEIRRRICESSECLGIGVDAEANADKGPRISIPASRVSALVIPTNEELMIARHTGLLLGLVAAHA